MNFYITTLAGQGLAGLGWRQELAFSSLSMHRGTLTNRVVFDPDFDDVRVFDPGATSGIPGHSEKTEVVVKGTGGGATIALAAKSEDMKSMLDMIAFAAAALFGAAISHMFESWARGDRIAAPEVQHHGVSDPPKAQRNNYLKRPLAPRRYLSASRRRPYR